MEIPKQTDANMTTSIEDSRRSGRGRFEVRTIRKSVYRSRYMFIALPLAAMNSRPAAAQNKVPILTSAPAAKTPATQNVNSTIIEIRSFVSSANACSFALKPVDSIGSVFVKTLLFIKNYLNSFTGFAPAGGQHLIPGSPTAAVRSEANSLRFAQDGCIRRVHDKPLAESRNCHAVEGLERTTPVCWRARDSGRPSAPK